MHQRRERVQISTQDGATTHNFVGVDVHNPSNAVQENPLNPTDIKYDGCSHIIQIAASSDSLQSPSELKLVTINYMCNSLTPKPGRRQDYL